MVYGAITSVCQGDAVYTNSRKWKLHRADNLEEAAAKRAQIIGLGGIRQIPRLAVAFMTRNETLGKKKKKQKQDGLRDGSVRNALISLAEFCGSRVENTQVGGVSDLTEHLRDEAACRGTTSGRLICQMRGSQATLNSTPSSVFLLVFLNISKDGH